MWLAWWLSSAWCDQNKGTWRQHSGGELHARIAWIDRLMQIPLEDYRKNAVSLILAPYLINIRKISPDQSNQSLIEWLERCNAVRRLDFRPRQRVKDSIKTAMKVKIPPLRLKTLRSRNPELHRMIVLYHWMKGAETLQLTMLLKRALSDGSRVMSGIKILYPISYKHTLFASDGKRRLRQDRKQMSPV